MLIVQLKPKKDVPVIKGHPWVFSGAVDKVQGSPEETSLCRVLDARGRFICQGFYNPFSQIAIRVLTRGREPVDRSFFLRRIEDAIRMRKTLIPADTTCYRVIHGEGDGIPGLTVDLYDTVLVMQFISTGVEQFKNDLVSIFHDLYPEHAIHERSDTKSRSAEGLRPLTGPLSGSMDKTGVQVREYGIPFVVDVLTGDRTGFYLDHRDNRAALQELASGKSVLDLFSYTGAYAVHALKGGASSVVSVDSSSTAQALMKRNMEVNKISPFVWKHVRDDAIRFLQDDRSRYDIVVCDSPPFMKEGDFEKALAMAMEKLNPSGLLFAVSYLGSQFTSLDHYRTIHASSEKACRNVRLVKPLHEGPDFPVLPTHPQGIHLFGHIVYVE
ncbi:MAG: class I SAM-dependent rRNA methyltransferase [Desulfomonilia bacterium]|jgi:23S rRNA (cytosine1962-C5)-methyltransferase|nr:class I SAM-dependent rRNA methyltransferase [Deltaproteobacteria bacterium]MDX9760634.1 class I SAM-dependent rRNA methyltransferase [Desulfomonilia bacterium]HPW68852.1 class I SAM-dependent rRNA methyltransferase [Deltaproteobacteria bacterium]